MARLVGVLALSGWLALACAPNAQVAQTTTPAPPSPQPHTLAPTPSATPSPSATDTMSPITPNPTGQPTPTPTKRATPTPFPYPPAQETETWLVIQALINQSKADIDAASKNQIASAIQQTWADYGETLSQFPIANDPDTQQQWDTDAISLAYLLDQWDQTGLDDSRTITIYICKVATLRLWVENAAISGLPLDTDLQRKVEAALEQLMDLVYDSYGNIDESSYRQSLNDNLPSVFVAWAYSYL